MAGQTRPSGHAVESGTDGFSGAAAYPEAIVQCARLNISASPRSAAGRVVLPAALR